MFAVLDCRESRFPDRGRKHPSFGTFVKFLTGRESRFPDRGRKLTSADVCITVLVVEKVDSPIGDENIRMIFNAFE